jgi:hypothetical protein
VQARAEEREEAELAEEDERGRSVVGDARVIFEMQKGECVPEREEVEDAANRSGRGPSGERVRRTLRSRCRSRSAGAWRAAGGDECG